MPFTLAAAPASSLDVSLEAWAILGAAIVAMLAVDLVLFGRGQAHVGVRTSAWWSLGWLIVALAFGVMLVVAEGSTVGGEYFAGYLLERSLSLDNLFVFAIILGAFTVPDALQPRVLGWGIVLALLFRLLFILAGATLLDRFHITFYAFGVLLLWTAWRIAQHDDAEADPTDNRMMRVVRERLPVSDGYHGTRLWTREAGRLLATPLVPVLLVVATTDLIFAVDSIPAIFAVTTVPFIVFAANAFAMLGLRALYFLLVGVMDRFVYLPYGLAVIVGAIGVKMLLVDVWHPPVWLSLVLIAVVLSVTAALSLRREPLSG